MSVDDQQYQCETKAKGLLYEGFCIQWEGQALVADRTSISGLDVIDDASDCKYGCSLWSLCAPQDQAYICEEAAEG